MGVRAGLPEMVFVSLLAAVTAEPCSPTSNITAPLGSNVTLLGPVPDKGVCTIKDPNGLVSECLHGNNVKCRPGYFCDNCSVILTNVQKNHAGLYTVKCDGRIVCSLHLSVTAVTAEPGSPASNITASLGFNVTLRGPVPDNFTIEDPSCLECDCVDGKCKCRDEYFYDNGSVILTNVQNNHAVWYMVKRDGRIVICLHLSVTGLVLDWKIVIAIAVTCGFLALIAGIVYWKRKALPSFTKCICCLPLASNTPRDQETPAQNRSAYQPGRTAEGDSLV
ncbi:uncharacterized protein LOC142486118 isoform X1 [Ascaphus truei]|uniref:uncharacterized protein LOC142486118 isoform X1 n=1 Tax=Ascaphus truei TaxID=8439 RepID=UPI003F5A8D3D